MERGAETRGYGACLSSDRPVRENLIELIVCPEEEH